MQRLTHFITVATLAIFGFFITTSLLAPSSAFAADNCEKEKFVQSSIIGKDYSVEGETLHGYCDDGEGGGVFTILNIILTVLTFGIGIAATAGLAIAGIKYATAGTNEAQATQARRRILEIIIGLIAYAILYLALRWLIPGFGN